MKLKYEKILVRRYSKETGEVAEKLYFNMTEKQAIAYFNKMMIGKWFGPAVVVAKLNSHGTAVINTIREEI